MAKNAVTDWSPTDSLNTDIGSTNIAEGCAPGGINDAIRKLMAQIATYIGDALHVIVRVGDAAFKLWLSGSNPRIEFDANDYLAYDRTANVLGVVIGGATCHSVSAAAASFLVPTTTLQDAQMPRLDLVRTSIATWHVGGSGVAGDSSFNVTLNAGSPSLKIDTAGVVTLAAAGSPGVVVTSTGMVTDMANGFAVYSGDPANYNISKIGTTTVVKGAGNVALSVSGTILLNTTGVVTTIYNPTLHGAGVSANGMLRVSGNSTAALPTGPAVEILYSAGTGGIQAYDRGGGSYSTLSIAGTNVNLQPQGGGVYSGGNHAVQGILSVGGAALGGVNGQVQVCDTGGVVRATLGWQAGNEYRIANTTVGITSFTINGTERARISANGLDVTGRVRSVATGTAGGAQLVNGTGTLTGYVEFLDTAMLSQGYIQQAINGDITYFNQNASAGHAFQGAYLNLRKGGMGGLGFAVGSAALTGRMILTDAAGGPSATIGGQAIGQPTLYSNPSGHAFNSFVQASGMVDGVSPGSGTSGGLRSRGDPGGGPAIIQMTNNAATNEWMSIVADPSGNKVTIIVGTVPVFSIDSSGNVRALGAITPNVTP